jgi:hypothetical protein
MSLLHWERHAVAVLFVVLALLVVGWIVGVEPEPTRVGPFVSESVGLPGEATPTQVDAAINATPTDAIDLVLESLDQLEDSQRELHGLARQFLEGR